MIYPDPPQNHPPPFPKNLLFTNVPLMLFFGDARVLKFSIIRKKNFFFREIEKHMRGIDIVLMFFVTNKIDIL